MSLTHEQYNAAKGERQWAYQQAFERERAVEYPVIDAFEAECGFAIDRAKLEDAARILACPLKANPPNWQHGRVIYAAVRRYAERAEPLMLCLDIGTAKGFSALCLHWAVQDGLGHLDSVVSVDVIDPKSHAQRNTVLECDGLKTLYETLAAWPEATHIRFKHDTGIGWLEKSAADRIHVAFVDGKHSFDVVKREGDLIAQRQQCGDLAIFDDLQVPGVAQAVTALDRLYHFVTIAVLPNRAYAVGTRR